jgi:hypothetical protein
MPFGVMKSLSQTLHCETVLPRPGDATPAAAEDADEDALSGPALPAEEGGLGEPGPTPSAAPPVEAERGRRMVARLGMRTEKPSWLTQITAQKKEQQETGTVSRSENEIRRTKKSDTHQTTQHTAR